MRLPSINRRGDDGLCSPFTTNRVAIRGMNVGLPFTPDQFFDVFGAYNHLLWPFALGLWLYALIGFVLLARSRAGCGRFIATMLAVQWAWAGLSYHAVFFTSINPAAWLFAGSFVLQSALLLWFGVLRDRLQFSRWGSVRHVVAWMLLVYSLLYPLIVLVEGHTFPDAPTFGLPCPTTLLTVGFLFAAAPSWPRLVAVIPVLWAFVAGSAASLLGVRADLMLWVAGTALSLYVLIPARSRVRVRHRVQQI